MTLPVAVILNRLATDFRVFTPLGRRILFLVDPIVRTRCLLLRWVKKAAQSIRGVGRGTLGHGGFGRFLLLED